MRILIAIMCCWHRESYADAQRETWIQDIPEGVDHRFFFGRSDKREPEEDEVFVDCKDDYRSLPMKVKGAMQWAYEHGYDYVFKTDDDVYVQPERLMASGFEKWPYSGFSFLEYGAVGLAYWLNRDCVKLAAEDVPVIEAEDSWISQLMKRNNVPFHHDSRYRLVIADRIGSKRVTPGSPSMANDMIAAAEFPGQTMQDPHRYWKASVLEYEEILSQVLL